MKHSNLGTKHHLYQKFGGKCHYCGARLVGWKKAKRNPDLPMHRKSTIDHKIPRAEGGTSDLHNLILSCERCNLAKKDTPYEVFIKEINHVSNLAN